MNETEKAIQEAGFILARLRGRTTLVPLWGAEQMAVGPSLGNGRSYRHGGTQFK